MKMRITHSAAFLAFLMPYFLQATQPFITEKFDQGFPANWTTGDDSNQNIKWEYCSDPQECPPAIFQTEPFSLLCRYDRFESQSIEDGFLYLNSYAAQGINNPHQSFVRTGNLDCSLKTSVFLKFYTLIAGGEILPEENAVLRVRVGNGSWTVFKIFHHLDENAETQNSWNPRVAVLDISSVAAQKDDVSIEWRWTGKNGYFWAIDDVEFFDENPIYENTVWGDLTGQGDFSGGFNNWAVTTLGNPCKWEWGSTGVIDVPDANLAADAVGCSYSILNGTASVNATFCYGGAFPYTRSDLKSPVIDLSGIPIGTRLALQFDQLVSIANPSSNNLPVTSVMVSVDGGSTFLDTIDANPLLPYRVHSCGTNTLNLPIEAAGSSNFRVFFVFAGDSEFWMVDDVRIIRQFDKDLRISKDFYAIAPNYSSPAGLASPVSLQADVENIGQEPMDEVALFATIEAEQAGIVFRDTLQLGSMMPGEIVLDTFFAKQFYPPDLTETYTVKYEVQSNEADQRTEDNVVRWKFETTSDLFSKDKGDCFINGSFTPYEEFEFEIGNCFYIPPGANVGAREISFAFEVPFSPQPSSLIGNSIRVKLYKWRTENTWGDVNGDSLATPDEITNVSINILSIEGDERYYQVHTVAVTEDSAYVILEDSTYYFATIGIENYAGPDRLFVSASEDLNYTSMYWTSYQYGFPNYVSILRLGDDNFFQVNGWGLQRIPIVRLRIDQLTATHEGAADPHANKLLVFPNPATDIVTVSLAEKTVKGPITVEILDIWGRLVFARQYDTSFVSQLPIDISGLSNGMYILRVNSEKYSTSSTLAIVKE